MSINLRGIGIALWASRRPGTGQEAPPQLEQEAGQAARREEKPVVREAADVEPIMRSDEEWALCHQRRLEQETPGGQLEDLVQHVRRLRSVGSAVRVVVLLFAGRRRLRDLQASTEAGAAAAGM